MLSPEEQIKIQEKEYTIRHLIAQGSFGSVYVAKDQQSQYYAIKVQDSMSAKEEEYVQTALTKKHEYIVNILAYQRISKYIYTVMDYGVSTLQQELKKKKAFKPDEIRFIIQSVAKGLQEINKAGFIHRDIKPENIIICQIQGVKGANGTQNSYKLCDFGLVAHKDQAKTKKIGTPYYMAPEVVSAIPQSDKDAYDEKADVWSLGAIMYELLKGKPLFEANTIEEIYSHIQDDKFVQDKIYQLTSSVDQQGSTHKQLPELLKNMLEQDPHKRLSVDTVIEKLKISVNINHVGQPCQVNTNEQNLQNAQLTQHQFSQASQTAQSHNQNQIKLVNQPLQQQQQINSNQTQQQLQIGQNDIHQNQFATPVTALPNTIQTQNNQNQTTPSKAHIQQNLMNLQPIQTPQLKLLQQKFIIQNQTISQPLNNQQQPIQYAQGDINLTQGVSNSGQSAHLQQQGLLINNQKPPHALYPVFNLQNQFSAPTGMGQQNDPVQTSLQTIYPQTSQNFHISNIQQGIPPPVTKTGGKPINMNPNSGNPSPQVSAIQDATQETKHAHQNHLISGNLPQLHQQQHYPLSQNLSPRGQPHQIE